MSLKLDQEIGCNVRGRLDYIASLVSDGKSSEAITEVKRLAKFFPKSQTFSFTEKEKLAASIIDNLTPVWINETGAYIAPNTFKALTVRLTELL